MFFESGFFTILQERDVKKMFLSDLSAEVDCKKVRR